MSLEDGRCGRLDAYSGQAMTKRGYRGPEKDARVREVRETLSRIGVERGDRALVQRIEDKLADREAFQGTPDHQILRMAVDTVVGDGKTKRVRSERTPVEVPLGDADYGRSDDPAELASRRERTADLVRAIASLSDRQRRIVEGVHMEGRSQAEVARELGAPRQTVNDELKRARGSLAIVLARHRDDYIPSR